MFEEVACLCVPRYCGARIDQPWRTNMLILACGLDDRYRGLLKRYRIDMTSCSDRGDIEVLLSEAAARPYDAIVIDLDEINYQEPLNQLVQVKLETPIFGVKEPRDVHSWPSTCAKFLKQGGQYLLMSPMNVQEFIASLRVAKRNMGGLRSTMVIRSDGCTVRLNRSDLEVFVGNARTDLTQAEFSLVWALGVRVGRIFTRQQLSDFRDLPFGKELQERSIDTMIKRIRKKLGDIDKRAYAIIKTRYGAGYGLFAKSVTYED